MRNDARRQSVAHYVLTIALGEKSQTKENGPDYADGLTGGPDFWEVYGVAAGDALNIRKAPKPDGALVAKSAAAPFFGTSVARTPADSGGAVSPGLTPP